jgi:23S rRNA U2552 (ribose-2'-O)-methylase RlmE/FtsJ
MTKIKEDKVTDDAGKDINCFIIMPISNQLGYEPGHFSLVYEDIIKPAVIAAGMKPIRADETKNTNLIQLDILRKVIESDIAICDMSSKNPNVFYELGVRQAFDKPTVLMIDEATTAPFDVSSLRYVDYKKGMGYRDVKQAVDNLTQTLKDTYAKREDKSEINSLIRLMDLTTPAQLNQVDISAEDRTALQISELASSMHNIQAVQNKILNSLHQANTSKFEFENSEVLLKGLLGKSRNSIKTLGGRAWEDPLEDSNFLNRKPQE